MSELTSHAVQAVLQLLVMCIIGFVGAKLNIIRKKDIESLSHILATVLTYCMLVAVGFNECDSTQLKDIFWVFLVTLFSQSIGFVIGMFVIRKKNNPNYWIQCSLAGPANCGFIGLAMISLMLGSSATVYVVGAMVSCNIIIFTFVYWSILGSFSSKSILNYLKSPQFYFVVLGVVFLIVQPKFPTFLTSSIQTVGNTVGPMALLVTGATLSQTNIKELLLNVNTYIVLFLRHIVAPLCVIPVMKLVPGMGEVAMTVALVISACPAPSMPVIFAIECDKDAAYASGVQSLSMAVVIATLPLMVYVYSLI